MLSDYSYTQVLALKGALESTKHHWNRLLRVVDETTDVEEPLSQYLATFEVELIQELARRREHPELLRENPMRKKTFKVFTFVQDYIAQHGKSPSLREIMTGVGYASMSVVSHHLDNMQRDGYIERNPKEARSIRILRVPSIVV